MLNLDHLTIISPTLREGVTHVQNCLDIDVPFGTRHAYMGTQNHRLQLGGRVYLEIVAVDPEGLHPGRPRWFGLDDAAGVRADWDAGRRLRGFVAATADISATVDRNPGLFGRVVALPPDAPEFAFAIPDDGSLPSNGAVPSLIDHKGDPTRMEDIPDLGARLLGWSMTHPDLSAIVALHRSLGIDRPPDVIAGSEIRFRARIATRQGERILA